MKSHRLLIAIAVLALLPIHVLAGGLTPQEERISLYPGESATRFGVTVSWHEDKTPTAPPSPTATQKPAQPVGMEPGMMGGMYDMTSGIAPAPPAPWGKLSFRGSTSTVDNITPPRVNSNNYIYIDEVYFDVTYEEAGMPHVPYVSLTINPFPSKRVVGGKEDDFPVAISSRCPVQMNEWKFALSDGPVRFADGSQALEIIATNEKTGEKDSLPAQRLAQRTFGRFLITVISVTESTRTVLVKVKADKDTTIRGRLACCEKESVYGNETAGAFFARIAEQYGFKVEWVSDPQYPGIVETMKNLRNNRGNNTYQERQNIEDFLKRNIAGDGNQCFYEPPGLALEWVDDTTLKIRPASIEAYTKKLREDEERDAEQKKLQDMRAELEARFATDYNLQTVVYSLKRISAATAKALVEPRLSAYYLVNLYNLGTGKSGGDKEVFKSNEVIAARNKGEYYTILNAGVGKPLVWSVSPSGTSDLTSQVALKSAPESCVVDEKANALIVTAIPKTHEQIRALIDQMEKVLSPESGAAAAPRRVRVQAILLRGDASKDSQAAAGHVDMAKQYGIKPEDLSLLPDMRISELGKALVDVLAEAGPSGRALTTLGEEYQCELEFQEERPPYVIIKGRLMENRVNAALDKVRASGLMSEMDYQKEKNLNASASRVLLENSVFLEPGKPALLGVTNLNQALILLLRLDQPTPGASSHLGQSE